MSHSSSDSLTDSIVDAVARREDIGPTELREPLYGVINPDALEQLFQDGSGKLTFQYHGYTVTVRHDGDVSVDDAAES